MSTGKPLRVRFFVCSSFDSLDTFLIFASLYSHHTVGVNSSPRDEEHQSATVLERTTGAPEEVPEANTSLTLKTSTSTRPERAADTTAVDAELLGHVSIFCLNSAYSCVGSAVRAPDTRICKAKTGYTHVLKQLSIHRSRISSSFWPRGG